MYKIPCECGKVYVGETGRCMHERIKEDERVIRLSRTQTSAVSEHANKTGNYPLWDEVKFIDRDPHWYSRRVKEAIHLRPHPNTINGDSRIEMVQIVRLSKSTLLSDEDLQYDIKVTIVRQTINETLCTHYPR